MRRSDRKPYRRFNSKARVLAAVLMLLMAFPFTASQADAVKEAVKEEANRYYDFAVRSLRAAVAPSASRVPTAPPQVESPAERAQRVARLRLCPRHLVLYVGEETVLMPTPLDSAGELVHSAQITWESQNPAVVSVSGTGDVTAVAQGRAVIMIRSGVARAPVAVEVRAGRRPQKSDAEFDAEVANNCPDAEASEISQLPASTNERISQNSPSEKRLVKGERQATFASFTTKANPATAYPELTRTAALQTDGETAEKIEAKLEAGAAEATPAASSSAFFQGGLIDGGGSEDTFSAGSTSYRNAIGSPRFAAQLESQSSGVRTRKVLGSYNYVLSIPVLSLPGRGSGTNLALIYNSQLWTKDGTDKMTFNYNKGWPTYGWSLGYGRIVDNYDDSDQGDGSGSDSSNAPGNKLLILPDGTRIHLHQSWDGAEWDFLAQDGSFLKFANNKLRFPDGTVIKYEKNSLTNNRRLPTRITSRNGAQVTITYRNPYPTVTSFRWAIETITDSLGRVITFGYEAATGELKTITAPGLNGSPRTLVQIDYQTITFDYNFLSGSGGITTIVAPAKGTSIKVVKRIFQPQTGRGYLFSEYSSYGMARKVAMHIGMSVGSDGTPVAYTKYNYTSYPDNQTGGIIDAPQYTERREWWQDKTDDSGNDAPSAETLFTHSRQTDTVNQKDTFIETDPLGNKIESTTGTDPASEGNGKLTETIIKNSSGTVLGKTINTYVIPVDGGTQLGTVESFDESLVQRVKTETAYGQFGGVSEIKEYGFTSTVQRKTTFGYKGGVHVDEHMLQLVDRVQVFDENGTLKAKTEFIYDDYNAMGGMESYNMPTNPYPLGHDQTFTQSWTTRGNITGVRTFSGLGPDVSVTRNSKYDIFGNAVEAQVSCCGVKTAKYGDSSGSVTAYSQPLFTTDGRDGIAPFLKTSYEYDSFTSLLKKVTDPDNFQTAIAYDSALRVDTVQSPTGASTITRFDKSAGLDTLSYFERVTYTDADSIQKIVTTRSWFDGAGRTLRSAVGRDSSSSSYDAVKTVYDSQGRAIWQSNPYLANSSGNPQAGVTLYYTKQEYDDEWRVKTVTLPDDQSPSAPSKIITDYSGSTVTVTDQVGRKRKSEVNGLGQLTKVIEQDATGSLSPGWETTYTYDTLDNLTGVNQGGQTRTFVYDRLSRLTSQITPEGGTVNFAYTDFNTIRKRTDARNVETHYAYDSLSRLQQVWYTGLGGNDSGTIRPALPAGIEATPDVILTYKTSAPGNGQVQQVNDSAGHETFGFDSFGRVNSRNRHFNDGNTKVYTSQYEYNQISQLTALTYPSNKKVRANYDARGRFAGLDKMNGSLLELSYLSQINYRVSGQISSLKLGNQSTESYTYSDTRLQLSGQSVTNASSQILMSLSYGYQAAAGASGAGTTAGNSGQLMGVTATINGASRNQSFTYDNVGRLVTATGSNWQRRFAYDRFGNRTGVWNATTGGTQIQTVTLQQPGGVVNNRLSTINSVNQIYDNAGNLTNDGVHTYSYDAENRLVKVDGGATGSYVYDSANRRVKRTAGGATVYSIWEDGSVIAEYSTATPTGAAATRFYHADRLSTRMITDGNGLVVGTQDHLPFGEDAVTGSGESGKHRFTNYERDAESGTDYAVNRQYTNSTGRFMRPDPESGRMGVPQSLNRYSYALNDPVNFSDPLGLNLNSVTCRVDGADMPCDWAMRLIQSGAAEFSSLTANGLTIILNKRSFYEHEDGDPFETIDSETGLPVEVYPTKITFNNTRFESVQRQFLDQINFAFYGMGPIDPRGGPPKMPHWQRRLMEKFIRRSEPPPTRTAQPPATEPKVIRTVGFPKDPKPYPGFDPKQPLTPSNPSLWWKTKFVFGQIVRIAEKFLRSSGGGVTVMTDEIKDEIFTPPGMEGMPRRST